MIKIEQFTFNVFAENTYLAYDETKEAVLIDCGCMNTKEEAVLSEFIKNNKLMLKRLLCTHYHIDHIVGNAFIYHTFDIKPEMHAGERAAGMPSLKRQISGLGFKIDVEEVEPKRFIEDNEEIRFGNSVLKALLVPGHSPASLAYYSEETKIAFTGDALFQGTIGRTDLWGGDYETLVSSINNRLFTLPDETVIYPGHESSSTIGIEKRTNPYFTGIVASITN
jgi:glyoxylase-like metal-dependent hydrolase (beta-lactamase superfamily II)